MSEATTTMAGVLLITVPAIGYGGVSLLRFIHRRDPYYVNQPLRQDLWRAGHAHAGVLVILALVGLLYLDSVELGGGTETFIRLCLGAAPILMPLGFFLSVASSKADKPNGLIVLTYLGGLALAAGALTLGVSLLRA